MICYFSLTKSIQKKKKASCQPPESSISRDVEMKDWFCPKHDIWDVYHDFPCYQKGMPPSFPEIAILAPWLFSLTREISRIKTSKLLLCWVSLGLGLFQQLVLVSIARNSDIWWCYMSQLLIPCLTFIHDYSTKEQCANNGHDTGWSTTICQVILLAELLNASFVLYAHW